VSDICWSGVLRICASSTHLLLQPSDLFFDPRRLDADRFPWLLPVGAIELTQISTDALLDLRHPPRHLGMREIAGLFTALNLLPSIPTLGVYNKPICRHRATNFAQAFRIAAPLSFRKSAIVL
jgi:hypothetical protein